MLQRLRPNAPGIVPGGSPYNPRRKSPLKISLPTIEISIPPVKIQTEIPPVEIQKKRGLDTPRRNLSYAHFIEQSSPRNSPNRHYHCNQ